MATTVDFYNSTDDPRVIGKNLSATVTGVNCNIKGSINILYPTFVLKWNSSIANSNYCMWNSKSYFITNKTLDSAKQMTISCAIDVLETYKDSIKSSPCTCIRSESEGKPTFVIDKSLPIEENRTENINVNFGNSFQSTFFVSDPQYMFITI